MNAVLHFFSQPYAQNMLTCVSIIITLGYVAITYRLLKSAGETGSEAAAQAKATRELVEVMREQLAAQEASYKLNYDVEMAAARRRVEQQQNDIAAANIALNHLEGYVMRLTPEPTQSPQVIRDFCRWVDNNLEDYVRTAKGTGYYPTYLVDEVRRRVLELATMAQGLKGNSRDTVVFKQDLERWNWLRERVEVAIAAARPNLSVLNEYPQENDSTSANDSETMKSEDKSS